MTTISVILVIAVVVLIGVGGIFLAVLFDGKKKEKALEKRMYRIEQNLGTINEAVHKIPQEMERTAYSVASSMAIPKQPQTEQQPQLEQKPVFKAPEPQMPVVKETVQEDTGIKLEDILDSVPDFNSEFEDVTDIVDPPVLPVINEPEIPVEEAKNQISESQSKEHQIDEIDEITLDDILEEFMDFEDVTGEEVPASKPEIEPEPEPVSAQPEPYEKVIAQPEPYEVVAAEPEPRETLEHQPEPEAAVAVQPRPIMDDRAIRAIMDEVITAEPEFIQSPVPQPNPRLVPAAEVADNNVPLKSGSRIRSILSDSAADSALDIYFTNGKFTPQESVEPIKDDEPEEAYDYGRSGKKYTVSELEALIRD